MTDLRQCPDCGGKPAHMNSNNLAFVIRCRKCGRQTSLERCEIDAAWQWNERRLRIQAAPLEAPEA